MKTDAPGATDTNGLEVELEVYWPPIGRMKHGPRKNSCKFYNHIDDQPIGILVFEM